MTDSPDIETASDVRPGTYQHFKGGIYQVIGVASTEADPTLQVVLYRAATDGTMWSRTVDNFAEHIDRDGYQGPRFRRLPDTGGTLPATIPATAAPTEFTLSPGSLDTELGNHFSIRVEWRGTGRWAICRQGQCLSKKGKWSYESMPSSRTDKWIANNRFDLDTALRLADKALGDIRFGDRTYEEMVAWQAERR